MKTATYFHDELCLTNKPLTEIEFVGQSLPYYDSIRAELNKAYPSNIPLKRVDINEYLSVHDRKFLDGVKELSKGVELDDEHFPPMSVECEGLQFVLPGYEYSLGGLYQIIDLMKAGEYERAYTFSLPSHHSYAGKGHGYCLLNTMSASIKNAQSRRFRNILIIDWDIHHGDGTQSLFENDPSVYQISIHSAMDLYMGMVDAIEYGTTEYGAKVGHCNIPVLDSHFDKAFWDKCEMKGRYFRADNCITQFEAELNRLPFSPDMIYIFDGHDSHAKDCGKGITDFTWDDYSRMLKMVLDLSKSNHCPVLSMLGGGYVKDVTVEMAKQIIIIMESYRL